MVPRKPWAYLVDILGIKQRAAKHRMAGTRKFSAHDLALLLRTEQGLDVLSAVMAGATPRWWRECVQQQTVAQARKGLRQAVKAALDADQSLSDAIATADAFSDADFHRPHLDALRAIGRVPDRALAQAAKRGGRS